MGQAIVYCSNCSAQLRGSDFEARKAFKVDDLIFCVKCYREVVGTEPETTPGPPSSSTKTKLPVGHSTGRIPVAPHLPPAAEPEGGSMAIYVGLGLGVVGLLIVVAAMSGGGGGERPSERSRETPPPPVAVAPPPVVAPPSSRETAAQEALARALRTVNLEARRALLAEAVAQSAGTPLFVDAQRELDRVERQLAEQKAAAAAKATPLAAPPPPPPTPDPKPAPPPPPPPPPDRSREEAALQAKWEAAVSPATGRDYAAASAALEKLGTAAPDVALLKAVAALHQEATSALARTIKGQKIALETRDGKAEGSFLDDEHGRVSLRNDSGSLEVEIGELLPSSLAELLRGRGGAVDPAAAAVYCLLEGDEAGARRLAGDKLIPDRYWTYARNVAAARDPARPLFQEAVALAAGAATAADAAPKFQALLRDHAETAFVRRNKASITARAQQCARDYLFVASELKPAGGLRGAKTAKGNTCWTSDADLEPNRRDTFVEFSYSVLPELTYRCWIYAGACCQETFEFWVQGTEMKSGKDKEPVEPGSTAAANVKPWFSSLKKTHSGHTGPKQASHWDWISIPMPKYGKAGLQQVRVMTTQKGFSVAYACVSATRTTPPKEFEMRELEKVRGAVAVTPTGPRPNIVFSLALDGTDKCVLGEVRDKSLYGVTTFNNCFAGLEGPPQFKVPQQGEFRMVYYLKTVTPLSVRIRVGRGGGKSDAYDAVIDPVAGRPVDVRLPFTAFKPIAGNAVPPMVVGDPIGMLYVIGEDVSCGLRVDALSILELKSGTAVSASKALFSENFDSGPGRFVEGESSDGGVNGTKAYAMTGKGASCWGPWSIPVKESTVVSFKLKPLGQMTQMMVLAWSDEQKDNGRIAIDGLKAGEWKEVRFKASQLRIGASGDGASIPVLNNIKIFPLGSAPEMKILLDDFEIRE